MEQTTKYVLSSLSGAVGILVAGGVVFLISTGVDIYTHVDVKGAPISEIQQEHETLKGKVAENTEGLENYGKQIGNAVSELEKVRLGILTRTVRGSVTRAIGTDKTGKNLIWVNRYSDARDFKTKDRVRINTDTAEIEATVDGYIKDPREEIIFKANTDVADIIGLTERAGIMRDVEIQRVLN